MAIEIQDIDRTIFSHEVGQLHQQIKQINHRLKVQNIPPLELIDLSVFDLTEALLRRAQSRQTLAKETLPSLEDKYNRFKAVGDILNRFDKLKQFQSLDVLSEEEINLASIIAGRQIRTIFVGLDNCLEKFIKPVKKEPTVVKLPNLKTEPDIFNDHIAGTVSTWILNQVGKKITFDNGDSIIFSLDSEYLEALTRLEEKFKSDLNKFDPQIYQQATNIIKDITQSDQPEKYFQFDDDKNMVLIWLTMSEPKIRQGVIQQIIQQNKPYIKPFSSDIDIESKTLKTLERPARDSRKIDMKTDQKPKPITPFAVQIDNKLDAISTALIAGIVERAKGQIAFGVKTIKTCFRQLASDQFRVEDIARIFDINENYIRKNIIEKGFLEKDDLSHLVFSSHEAVFIYAHHTINIHQGLQDHLESINYKDHLKIAINQAFK